MERKPSGLAQLSGLALDTPKSFNYPALMNPRIPTPLTDDKDFVASVYRLIAQLERDREILREALEKIVAGDTLDGGTWSRSQCVEIASAALEATKEQP